MTIRLRSWWMAGACLVLAAVSGWASTAYSKGDRVNVRSRPGYAGEIITQLKRGQEITVLGTNVLVQTAADEPATWLKVSLPAGTALWVNAEFVDATSKEVTADVLNVRAGPSLDHAAVARIKRGTVLKDVGEIKQGWLQVGAPEGAVGFVPAHWVTWDARGTPSTPGWVWAEPPVSGTSSNSIAATPSTTSPTKANSSPATPNPTASQAATSAPTPVPARPSSETAVVGEAALPAAAVATPAPADTAATVSTNAVSTTVQPGGGEGVEPATAEVSSTQQPVRRGWFRRKRSRAETPAPAVATEAIVLPAAATNAPAAAAAPVAEPEKPDARWVRREGVVVRPSHIQAPSFQALQSRDRRVTINFLRSSPENPINWAEYRGRVVVVTGREYLDRRPLWKGIPILEVEQIEAVR